MNEDKLNEAIKLREDIKKLEDFLLFTRVHGNLYLERDTFKLKVFSAGGCKRELKISGDLLVRVVSEVKKELQDLEYRFKNL